MLINCITGSLKRCLFFMPFSPIILTDQELEDFCKWCTEQVYIYYPVATDYFKDLYNTGCRPTELLSIGRWLYIDDFNIQLQPLKSNTTRTFTASELTSTLIDAIILQYKPYQSLSLRQVKNVLQKLITVQEIKTTNKSAIEYMFRYNKVKQLHISGKTDVEIQSIFGWQVSTLPASYFSQTLYRIGDLPPFVTNGIIDADGTFIIDSDSTFIISQ